MTNGPKPHLRLLVLVIIKKKPKLVSGVSYLRTSMNFFFESSDSSDMDDSLTVWSYGSHVCYCGVTLSGHSDRSPLPIPQLVVTLDPSVQTLQPGKCISSLLFGFSREEQSAKGASSKSRRTPCASGFRASGFVIMAQAPWSGIILDASLKSAPR